MGESSTAAPAAVHTFVSRPTDHWIAGAGPKLHCLDWGGKEDGLRLLFLHGGGLTAHTWDVVCDLLHINYRCRAMDLRGHGDSGWSDDGRYPVDDHVADIRRAVDQLGLSDFVLVGMSLGGTAGLLYAGAKPRQLAGLVLVDTGWGFRAPNSRVREFMSGPAEADFEDFVERAFAFNPRRTRDQLRRSLLSNLCQLANGKWSWKYDRRNLAAPAVDIDELRRRLVTAARNVHCPTLVVRGGDSDMFLDEDAASLSGLIPNAEWQRIDGAGHTVQGDRPHELADVLTAFLGRFRLSR